MPSHPLVSVIVPSYNKRPFIEEGTAPQNSTRKNGQFVQRPRGLKPSDSREASGGSLPTPEWRRSRL